MRAALGFPAPRMDVKLSAMAACGCGDVSPSIAMLHLCGTGIRNGTSSRISHAPTSSRLVSTAACCCSSPSTSFSAIHGGGVQQRRCRRQPRQAFGGLHDGLNWSCEDGAASMTAGDGGAWRWSSTQIRVETWSGRRRWRRIWRWNGRCHLSKTSTGFDANVGWFPRDRRTCGVRCSSSEEPATSPVSDEGSVAELPCLPFTPSEVFVPSSTKVLHLYEARFLALLEQVMGKYDNLFAHIVIEPMKTSGRDEESKGVASFIATYGCLARIEKVKRLEIGAEVTIRGIGRIKLIGLTQLEPFLKGTVVSLKDESSKNAEELGSAIEELRTTLSTVQQLQIKLKVPEDELLQTPLERALYWAEKGEPDQVADSYLPSREERVSFAALQPVAGASAAEQHKLLQERLYAMETMDTLQRLKRVKPYAQQTVASLAAKLSIQSLNL